MTLETEKFYKKELLTLLNEWSFIGGIVSVSEKHSFHGEVHIHLVFPFNYNKDILTKIEKKYFKRTDKYLRGQHLFTTGLSHNQMALGTFRITEKEFENLYDLLYRILENLYNSHFKLEN